jgi:hypothetical protein
MSMNLLIEKLIAAPAVANQTSGTVDGIEVGDEKITFKCPFSLCQIKYPGKGKKCTHSQCFDLEVSISARIYFFSQYSLEPQTMIRFNVFAAIRQSQPQS